MDNWFKDVEGRFVKDPKFSECFKDPRQLYNQDETPITWGTKLQKVLAVKGFSGPAYNLGGFSREHTTVSVLVGADGSVPAIRIVWSGKRWSQAERDLQENIPADGVTGKFKFSKTPSGYVTREVFLEILSDLTDHITEHIVPQPVILVKLIITRITGRGTLCSMMSALGRTACQSKDKSLKDISFSC